MRRRRRHPLLSAAVEDATDDRKDNEREREKKEGRKRYYGKETLLGVRQAGTLDQAHTATR